MSYPISELIAGREVTSVLDTDTVKDALVKMVSNDYSQLPVVDRENRLVGVISEQTIVRRYYMSEGLSLFDLAVNHCMTRPVTLSPEDEVFDALGRLQEVPAIVIVDDGKPVGVVTYFDTTHFFRSVSEGLMYVEDIELRLRTIIERVLDEEPKLTAALFKAFGHDRRNSQQPGKLFEELTFHDHVQLITSHDTWPSFESFLAPRDIFLKYMAQVRSIRNQIAHFRDDVSTFQVTILTEARDWLFSRSLPAAVSADIEMEEPMSEAYSIEESGAKSGPADGKYARFSAWLLRRPKSETRLELDFNEFESLLEDTLPEAARKHATWWENDPDGRAQARAWLQAGWLVDNVDFTEEKIHFRRSKEALYILFHHDALVRLAARRPIFASSKGPRPYHWQAFSTDMSGISFGWSFNSDGTFSVGLTIATGDAKRNAELYDLLYQRKDAIEGAVGKELIWMRETSKGTAIIEYSVPGRLTSPQDKLEELMTIAADVSVDLTDACLQVLQGNI